MLSFPYGLVAGHATLSLTADIRWNAGGFKRPILLGVAMRDNRTRRYCWHETERWRQGVIKAYRL